MLCNGLKPTLNPWRLAVSARRPHCGHMRIASLLLLMGGIALAAKSLPEDGFGNWKVNPVRSTNPYPGSVVLRIEPHPKGEVFTLDRLGDLIPA